MRCVDVDHIWTGAMVRLNSWVVSGHDEARRGPMCKVEVKSRPSGRDEGVTDDVTV